MKIYKNIYSSLVSIENLLASWHIFKLWKSKRTDVQEFAKNLEKNIFDIHNKLISWKYKHWIYEWFYIHDPKLRFIHKAKVRDRIVHQAIYASLTPIFEQSFIHHSYSCRIDKWTHKAVKAFEVMTRKVSKNYTWKCYVLKCDVKKFFDSINHTILLNILKKRIKDDRAIGLFSEVVSSFSWFSGHIPEWQWLPLWNLTSQIFANIYLNELDQFIKHTLKETHYIRYADDFAIISKDKDHLKSLIDKIEMFLNNNLNMRLHPYKVHVNNAYQWVDFLWCIVFPHYKIMRTNTKMRMMKKINDNYSDYMRWHKDKGEVNQVFQSYFWIMSHADCFRLSSSIKNHFWIN